MEDKENEPLSIEAQRTETAIVLMAQLEALLEEIKEANRQLREDSKE